MKRVLSVVAISLLTIAPSVAQTFKSGDNLVTGTLGIGNAVGVPLEISYEYGLQDINDTSSLGIGVMLGYGRENTSVVLYAPDSSTSVQTEDLISRSTYTGVLVNYHYTGVEDFDFTGGLTLGYERDVTKYKGDSDSKEVDNDPLFRLHVGARYYFTDNFAAVGTLNFTDNSILNIGVSYKW